MPQKEVQQVKRQHAVPQNIMSVEFKLIGDMTVRQFFYVAAGGILALLFFKSGLPFLVRWFFTIFFGILGAGMAFVPFEERGLDVWIASFVRILGSSTQMVWKKDPNPPIYFLSDYAKLIANDALAVSPIKTREKLYEYLNKIKTPDLSDPYEVKKAHFLSSLNYQAQVPQSLVSVIEETTPQTPPVAIEAPTHQDSPKKEAPKVEVAEIPLLVDIGSTKEIRNIKTNRPIKTFFEEREIVLPKSPVEHIKAYDQKLSDLSPNTEKKMADLKKVVAEIKTKEEKERKEEERKQQERLQKEAVKIQKEVEVISPKEIVINKQEQTPKKEEIFKKEEEKVRKIEFVETPKSPKEEKPGKINLEDTNINIIKGRVIDNLGHVVEGALLLIKDESGDPERALKTNALGEFSTVTRLDNGSYFIETKYPNNSFDVINFKAEGKPISFITIKAKG